VTATARPAVISDVARASSGRPGCSGAPAPARIVPGGEASRTGLQLRRSAALAVHRLRQAALCILLDGKPEEHLVDYVDNDLGLLLAWLTPAGVAGGPRAKGSLPLI
jgi:hypothetical protein